MKSTAMTSSARQGLLYSMTVIFFLSTPALSQISDEEKPRDVEIGPGGRIILEKQYRSELKEFYELYANALLESRYITEGRDNLSGHGIYSASTELKYKGITIIPWIADAIGTDYSEANLNLVYGFRLSDDLELFTGYSYIQSRTSGINAHDSEISLGIVYFLTDFLHVSTSAYYSFDADGAFTEAAMSRSIQIDDAFSIDIAAILGFNSGYVVDGHNGINYAQLLVRASYLFIDVMELYAYTGYNQAIGREANLYPGDESLRDLLWGGAGLIYRF